MKFSYWVKNQTILPISDELRWKSPDVLKKIYELTEQKKAYIFDEILSKPTFYDTYTFDNETENLSNFDTLNDYSFWQVLKTNEVQLFYDRKEGAAMYHEWDKLLGPLTLSGFDKIKLEFDCLNGL